MAAGKKERRRAKAPKSTKRRSLTDYVPSFVTPFRCVAGGVVVLAVVVAQLRPPPPTPMGNVIKDMSELTSTDLATARLPAVLDAMAAEAKTTLQAYAKANAALEEGETATNTWHTMTAKERDEMAHDVRAAVRADPLLGASTDVWKDGRLAAPGGSNAKRRVTMEMLAPEVFEDEFAAPIWDEPRHLPALIEMVAKGKENDYLDVDDDEALRPGASKDAVAARQAIVQLKKRLRTVLLGKYLADVVHALARRNRQFSSELHKALRPP